MNKKGFFFFIFGSESKQDVMRGVFLRKRCKCQGNLFNIHYNLTRGTFFFIPLGGWNIKNVILQCVRCGENYELKGRAEEQAEKLYYNISEKMEEVEYGDLKRRKEEKLSNLRDKKRGKFTNKSKKMGANWFTNFKEDIKSLRH